MANVLGGDDEDVYDKYIHVDGRRSRGQGAHVRQEVRPGRKIGHVTVTGDDPAEAASLLARARRAASYLRWGKEDGE